MATLKLNAQLSHRVESADLNKDGRLESQVGCARSTRARWNGEIGPCELRFEGSFFLLARMGRRIGQSISGCCTYDPNIISHQPIPATGVASLRRLVSWASVSTQPPPETGMLTIRGSAPSVSRISIIPFRSRRSGGALSERFHRGATA